MDVKKLCPFCDESFDGNTIKTHIGIEHLGIVLNQGKTGGSKNEIENDEVICATHSGTEIKYLSDSKEGIYRERDLF